MKQTTSERLKYLLDVRNLRQADVLRMIEPYSEKLGVKIQRNALSQYVKGKVVPKQDKLTLLGMALNVSEIWLMGYDVPMEREITAPAAAPKRSEIISLFSALKSENQRKVLDYAQLLLTVQQAESDSQV